MILIKWNDGITNWNPLKNLKEFNPVEVAECLVARNISYKPIFSWWVTLTLNKIDRIIDAVYSIVSKKTHKFGIEVPMSIEYAKRLETKNGDMIWQDSITKYMYQVFGSFQDCVVWRIYITRMEKVKWSYYI